MISCAFTGLFLPLFLQTVIVRKIIFTYHFTIRSNVCMRTIRVLYIPVRATVLSSSWCPLPDVSLSIYKSPTGTRRLAMRPFRRNINASAWHNLTRVNRQITFMSIGNIHSLGSIIRDARSRWPGKNCMVNHIDRYRAQQPDRQIRAYQEHQKFERGLHQFHPCSQTNQSSDAICSQAGNSQNSRDDNLANQNNFAYHKDILQRLFAGVVQRSLSATRVHRGRQAVEGS